MLTETKTLESLAVRLKSLGFVLDVTEIEPATEDELKDAFEYKAKCKYCDSEATKESQSSDANIKTCSKHTGMARRAIKKHEGKAEVIDLIAFDEASFAEGLADELEEKRTVITPGGRVGNNRKLGSSRNGVNWVERDKPGNKGSLPEYIRIVRNGLMKQGHTESRATALAVAAVKRWARGGANVSPKVRAAAAKALAEWEKMKAKARAKTDEAADLEEKREFSSRQREGAASSGHALPDGSFPIESREDLKNAVQALGRAKNKAKAKAHILKRARALGAMDLIPDSWKGNGKSVLDRIEDIEEKARYVRTQSGVDRFNQPIGSIIVGGGSKLKNIRVIGKVKGAKSWYEVQNRKGDRFFVGQFEDGEWGVIDAKDDETELYTAADEDDVLMQLDEAQGKGPRRPVTTRKATAKDKPAPKKTTERPVAQSGKGPKTDNLKPMKSEYETFSKYKGKDGKTYYVDDEPDDNGDFSVYDDNDEVLMQSPKRDVLLARLNSKATMVEKVRERREANPPKRPGLLNKQPPKTRKTGPVEKTTQLSTGDKVKVTVDGKTYDMTVARTYNDPSIGAANSHTVIAHIRPGGYSVTLRNDNLKKYKVEHAGRPGKAPRRT